VWFDSHCHLYDLGDAHSIADAVSRARLAGVAEILVPGVDPTTSLRAIEIAVDHDLWAAVGIHPSESSRSDEPAVGRIEDLLGHPRVVAIGETGLDFYRDHVPPDVQRMNFARHIALAKEHSKAVVIHTRESADAALDMLEEQGVPAAVVFHCWSGDDVQLKRALNLGAFISFAGNVTFKSASALRDAARSVPEERLLIETDAPYLTPVPHRGQPNEPAHVTVVGAAVAKARGEPVDRLAQITRENARRAFTLADP
jgi:TatD DNase family protein